MPPPGPPIHLPPIEILSIEIFLFLLVSTLCFLIFKKTKTMYLISKHEGIKNFRLTFLFFGLTYLFRFIHILLIFAIDRPSAYHALSLMFVSFFSTMAIFSLALAILTRHINLNVFSYVPYALALAFSLIVFLTKSHLALIVLQAIIFVVAFIIALVKSHKLSFNKVNLLLLFVFWLLLTLVFTKGLIPIGLRIPLYIISALLFIWIYRRVTKRLTSAA